MATKRNPLPRVSGIGAPKQRLRDIGAARTPQRGAKVESSRPPSQWTFLTNHAHVLLMLALNEGMVLKDIAVRVGITERAVQNIISELSEEGFLERVKVGRVNNYKLFLEQPLRHPIESHRSVGDLVRLVRDAS